MEADEGEGVSLWNIWRGWECRWTKTTYTPNEERCLGSAKMGEHAATQHNNILFFSRISSHLLSNGLPVFLNCPIFYFF